VVEQHAIVGKISSLPHDCSNQVGMTFPHCIHVSVRFGTMTQSLQQKANAVVASSIVHSIRKTMYDDRTNQEGDTQLCAGHEGPGRVAWAACCCN
jgi:hypothetical protein